MPTVNIYVSERELVNLSEEAKKQNIRIPLLIRKIIREWLLAQGYGAE